jgi:hypothetical protein
MAVFRRTDLHCEFAQQQGGAHAFAIRYQGFVQQATGFVVPVVQHFVRRHLAAELGDFLLPEMIGMVGHGFGNGDSLGPFLFLLVDLQQVLQGFLVPLGAAQLDEDFFGAIEQTGLEVVLAEFGEGVQPLVLPTGRRVRSGSDGHVWRDRFRRGGGTGCPAQNAVRWSRDRPVPPR